MVGEPIELDYIVHALSQSGVCHRNQGMPPMPSVPTLEDVMEKLRSVLYPGYFGHVDIAPPHLPYYIGATLEEISRCLGEQIRRGFCFFCPNDANGPCQECESRSRGMAAQFVQALPHLRDTLATDVQAAYEGDPAATNPGEAIFCYPSIKAVTNYRIAHALHNLGVHLIPRIITELAHSQTGIDIHPGAQIGDRFFIDHGTGTVIGETCRIGHNVRLYQGVTLGAKSFPKDDSGKLIKGIPRHPIVEDNVIIYSGATILGRVTIGREAVIGGNVWVTEDVAPHSRVVQPLEHG